MKKVAIVTLISINYGNRLQNYALQEILKKNNCEVETIINNYYLNNKYSINNNIKFLLSIIKNELLRNGKYRIYNSIFTDKQTKLFLDFNKDNIIFSKKTYNFKRKLNYDYYIVGSDQVWNPYFGLSDFGLLEFIKENEKKISYAASIGVDKIPNNLKEKYNKGLSKFKYLSIREEKGKEILKEITKRKDIEVLVDPTMLLTTKEWDKISKRPKQLDSIKEKKYIFIYFLGVLSESIKKEIERIAKEYNCHIINVLDKNDPFYETGPCEFIYLEKHAFLICTDSFHSSIFALLYNKPFIVFDRKQKNNMNMNSRIDTFINKFKLKDRRYNGTCITKENIKHDYTEAYKILEKERKKSNDFLVKALNNK